MARGRKKGSKDKKKRIMSENSLANLNKRPTLEKRNEYLSRSSKRNFETNYRKYLDKAKSNIRKASEYLGRDDIGDYINRTYSEREYRNMRKATINMIKKGTLKINGSINDYLADKVFSTSKKQTKSIEKAITKRRSTRDELGPISRKQHWEIRVKGTDAIDAKELMNDIEERYNELKEEKINDWLSKNPGKSRQDALKWGLGLTLSIRKDIGQEFFGSE